MLTLEWEKIAFQEFMPLFGHILDLTPRGNERVEVYQSFICTS